MNVTTSALVPGALARAARPSGLTVLSVPKVIKLAAKLALIASGLTAMGYAMALCFTQFA